MTSRPKIIGRLFPTWAWVAIFSLLGSAVAGAFIPRHLPHIHDEFAYLFAGQTFAHFTLTNPTPPLWRFFESHHILMEPSMMAKYPAGPGLALALGFWLGNPLYGIWLTGAAFAAATTWMLRGFFAPRWALLGGVLISTQFGPTHYWTQSYWGGALTATGGALVFGGACRIWRRPRTGDALLLGLGVVILMHTRPFEGLLACLVPAGLVLRRWLGHDGAGHRPTLVHFVLPCSAVIALGALALAYSNLRVTGSPWHLPYLEYEHRYLGTPAFTWQSEPTEEPAFTNSAFADFYQDYVQTLRYEQPSVAARLAVRLRLLAADYFGWALGALALVGVLWQPDWRVRLALTSIAVIALPLALSYLFMPHYQAPAAALGGLLAITGLRRLFLSLPRRRRHFGFVAALLLLAQGLSLAGDTSNQRRLAPRRIVPLRQKIEDSLIAGAGRHLIFVQLVKPYYLHETWVFNYAPIDAQPVIWAWDRGPAENRLLMDTYRDRNAVRMTLRDGKITFSEHPDAAPPPLTPP
ncbi:MAG: hypothetical protein H7343_21540 [Undibacterium sp.]|nr:hypothetical protein [Opitutaceae bacterium]